MAITMLPLDATAGSPSFTAQQTRQALSALFGVAPTGRPLGATSGVRPGTPATTVFLTGAGSTTWNVAAHSGGLDTQTSALAGPYTYATDGTDTGSITAADPTNPRVDIVYVKVNDNVLDGSGAVNGQVLYLAGTPAASPSAPATPARSMVLATIAVPKVGAGAPAVTWVAPILGGPQSTANTAVFGGIRFSWGSVVVSLVSAAQGTATIIYPVAFSSAPIAVATPVGTSIHFASFSSIGATSAVVSIRDRNDTTSTTSITVNWHAFGPA